MSLLVLKLPARQRLVTRAAAAEGAASLRLPSEWAHVFSADGRSAGPLSLAPAALLPKASKVVLVLAEADVSWHRVKIPKAPAQRLRAALGGVLEEQLLDDDDALHLALGPSSSPGQPGWVAATHGPRLKAVLAALEQSGVVVEQVVSSVSPVAADAPARAHFFKPAEAADDTAQLLLATAQGVVSLSTSSGLARALLPAQPAADVPSRSSTVVWSAEPAAALAAERWLGSPLPLLTEAEHLLQSAQTEVNLLQFELASRHRGSRWLRDLGQRLLSPAWRPLRIGLASLLVLQLVGLNAYAWQQQQAVQDKRQAMSELLLSTFPSVRTVLDAPVQMASETARLRAAAGRAGGSDLEALLAAAASAWPAGQGPTAELRFDAGQLTVSSAGWREDETAVFRAQLAPLGLAVRAADGLLTLSRQTEGALP